MNRSKQRKYLIGVSLLLLVTLFPSTGAAARVMTQFKVSNATSRGAVCNDGTPAVYFLRRGYGKGKNIWVIALEGGGFCNSIASCLNRHVTSRGSMTSEGQALTVSGDGILSPSHVKNPDFFNANEVLIHYCSSDLWSGNRRPSAQTGGFAFKGFAIVRTVIQDLMDTEVTPSSNLADATDVLFAGFSAGGVGVLPHLDWVASQLPQARVRGLDDAGWVVDIPPFNSAINPDNNDGATISFWASHVDASCADANPEKERFRCLSPSVYPYLTTPLFVQMSQHDTSQLTLKGITFPLDAAEQQYAATFGQKVRQALRPVKGAFSPNSYSHSLSPNKQFYLFKIKDNTLRDALGKWFFERKGRKRFIQR